MDALKVHCSFHFVNVTYDWNLKPRHSLSRDLSPFNCYFIRLAQLWHCRYAWCLAMRNKTTDLMNSDRQDWSGLSWWPIRGAQDFKIFQIGARQSFASTGCNACLVLFFHIFPYMKRGLVIYWDVHVMHRLKFPCKNVGTAFRASVGSLTNPLRESDDASMSICLDF